MALKVILASESPRRKELLARIVPTFKVVPSRTEELIDEESTPEENAVANALRKARRVSRQYPGALIVGADTVVVLGGRILGKPSNREKATSMLETLSGRTHSVITGLAVLNTLTGEELTGHETTWVTFKPLSREMILDYVGRGTCLDKAGAYGIQDVGEDFIASVKGDYENVVGLPLKLVGFLLEKARTIPNEQ